MFRSFKVAMVSMPSALWFILATAAMFMIAFHLQIRLLSSFDYLPGISLLFLPHGIRVMAALIGRGLSIPGLFLGSLGVSWMLDGRLSAQEVSIAGVAAVMPYLALRAVEGVVGEMLMARFNALRLLAFVALSSVFCSLAHVVLFALFEGWAGAFSQAAWVSMLSGDFGGGLLFIAILWVALKTLREWAVPARAQRHHPGTLVQWFERTAVVAGAVIIGYYLQSLVKEISAAPGVMWAMAPLFVLIMASWHYREGGLAGWTLGALSVDSHWVEGSVAMLGFALTGAAVGLLALATEGRGSAKALRSRTQLMRHGGVVSVLYVLAYGAWLDAGDPGGLMAVWMIMGVTGLLVLGLVLWPLLCLIDRRSKSG